MARLALISDGEAICQGWAEDCWELATITALWLVRRAGFGQNWRMSRAKTIAEAALLSLCLNIVPMAAVLGLAPRVAVADEAQSLTRALAAAEAKDWPTALAEAQGAGQIGGDVIRWQWLRDGQGNLGDYEEFIARRADWPGLQLLREKGEVAVARSTDPARIVAYFAKDKPRTGLGAVTLVGALKALGRESDAEAEAFRAWAGLKFTAEDQTALLAQEGAALKTAHEVRLDRLLWAGGRRDEVARMLPLVGPDWRALAEARIALDSDAPDVSAKVKAVPKALAKDAGLAYGRFVWRMRKDLYPDSMTMIIEHSGSAASLGDPAAWADRRALLARYLMRTGDPKDAYKVAAGHHLKPGADYVDLEFLSGFIALRKLNDPATAIKHFGHMKEAVETPISLARAHYWMGRALEAQGDAGGAKAEFQKAARYQTAFYGLMAAEKLGLNLDSALISDARPKGRWQDQPWAKSSVLQAARVLLKAGDLAQAKRFVLHLAEGLDGNGITLLSEMALEINQPHIAVLVGKAAAERGIILTRAYYPVPAMVPDGLAVSRALALAIARRESEFDPKAQSHAGARGLMQLMPETAERMSSALGLPYSLASLTADPPYNVRVGSEYLAKMAENFGPSVALIASGYNAGPNRPKRWIAEFGDPRSADVDVVDWVETIPFGETRTYVMRVAEGVVIYRAKLRGSVGPVNIRAELTGR